MSTKRRLGAPLILMFGVIIALVAFAAPANAGDYAHHRRVSVSNETPTAGSSVQFCGIGFQSLKTVTIGWDNGTTSPSAVADSSGNFCSIIVLGADLTGTHTITAREATSAGPEASPRPGRHGSAQPPPATTPVVTPVPAQTEFSPATGATATSGATASATIVVPGVSANASPPAAAGSATIVVPGVGVSANASPPAAAGLAFTGAAVLGIGSLGALLLVGGAALTLAGRRRKVDA